MQWGRRGGEGVVAEPSKKKSVDSSINNFFKQVIKIRRKRIFSRRLDILVTSGTSCVCMYFIW